MTTTAVKENRIAEAGAPSNGAPPLPLDASLLTLGIAPVIFSAERFSIGRLDPDKHDPIRELRKQHSKTHALRFDSRDGTIANIGLEPGIDPLGDIEEARVAENLLLLAEAIQHKLRRWLSCAASSEGDFPARRSRYKALPFGHWPPSRCRPTKRRSFPQSLLMNA